MSTILTLTIIGSIAIPLNIAVFPTFVTTIYSAMMFASSYVEEEHHIWYWSTAAWMLILYIFQYVAK
jgi:ethanolamine phosphate transferase 2 subunit G